MKQAKPPVPWPLPSKQTKASQQTSFSKVLLNLWPKIDNLCELTRRARPRPSPPPLLPFSAADGNLSPVSVVGLPCYALEGRSCPIIPLFFIFQKTKWVQRRKARTWGWRCEECACFSFQKNLFCSKFVQFSIIAHIRRQQTPNSIPIPRHATRHFRIGYESFFCWIMMWICNCHCLYLGNSHTQFSPLPLFAWKTGPTRRTGLLMSTGRMNESTKISTEIKTAEIIPDPISHQSTSFVMFFFGLISSNWPFPGNWNDARMPASFLKVFWSI